MVRMTFRIWALRGVFVIAFATVIAHLYTIQIEKGDIYERRIQAREEQRGTLDPTRGIIYVTDKNGTATSIVMNKEYPTIFAVPTQIADASEAAQLLAPVVNKDVAALERMLSKNDDQYELLVAKATAEQVKAVQALHLPTTSTTDPAIKGVYVEYKPFRFYPFGTLAAHVLGFISPSDDGPVEGRYGLELAFENILRGTVGGMKGNIVHAAVAGADVHASIDRAIQSEVESVLTLLVKEWQAEGGTIIVQDPLSGKIRAMANIPTFDPNEYSRYDVGVFQNSAVELVYEPGSVFKIVTMAAALDSGAVTPDTTYTDTGSVVVNKRVIKNWDEKAHGVQTMTSVIEQSLNTGAVFAETKTGHTTFTSYVEKFGFGELTAIELPGEVRGSTRQLKGGRDVNYATASFGQGISVTPVQIINAFSAVANGGLLMKPTILEDNNPLVVRRVISPQTARTLIDIMISAVDKNVIAHIPHYRVAGKTGTAFIPILGGGGYAEDEFINTYIGFAPAYNARFVILVRLTKPKGAPLAGQSVVPAFKKLTQFLLNYYEVPPDSIGN